MGDVVVGSDGAEGFLHRAAPDQLGVWDKPAEASSVRARVRWEPGVVRQGASRDLRIDIAQGVFAAQAGGSHHLSDSAASRDHGLGDVIAPTEALPAAQPTRGIMVIEPALVA